MCGHTVPSYLSTHLAVASVFRAIVALRDESNVHACAWCQGGPSYLNGTSGANNYPLKVRELA
jgi:hypothetical protein